ncbi:MAG: GntR family transcriptional regulator [Spirochaetota bacterium]|nr:GntR family transcriptional regulator [Spirochaetota bacterium]
MKYSYILVDYLSLTTTSLKYVLQITSALSNTIYSRVSDNLRMAIVSGEFDPGERLKMADLITRFGTSQMPIREALQQLQGEGLIKIIPHRGAQVITIDQLFIKNISFRG